MALIAFFLTVFVSILSASPSEAMSLEDAIAKLKLDTLGEKYLAAAEAKAAQSGGLRKVLGYCALDAGNGAAVVYEPDFSVSDFQAKSLPQLLGPVRPMTEEVSEVQFTKGTAVETKKAIIRTIDRRDYFEVQIKNIPKPWIICINKDYQGTDLDVYLLHELVHYVDAVIPKSSEIKKIILTGDFTDYANNSIYAKGLEYDAYLTHWSYAIRTQRPEKVPAKFLKFFDAQGNILDRKSEEMKSFIGQSLLEGSFIDKQESVTPEMHVAIFGYRFNYAKEYYEFVANFRAEISRGVQHMVQFRGERQLELAKLEASAKIAAAIDPDPSKSSATLLLNANRRAIQSLTSSIELYQDLKHRVSEEFDKFTAYLVSKKWLKTAQPAEEI